MAKCYVEIGFVTTEETIDENSNEGTGIWVEKVTPKNYYADIIKNSRMLTSDNKVNSDLMLNNTFSIIADPYLMNNFFAIRYIKFNGNKWEVSGVEVQYPRLLLSIGGLYNG